MKQLDVGWERMRSCQELVHRLIKNNHPESKFIQETQGLLRYQHTNVLSYNSLILILQQFIRLYNSGIKCGMFCYHCYVTLHETVICVKYYPSTVTGIVIL